MSDFTTINGLQVLSSTPIGDAGQALNNNFLTIGTSLTNLASSISTLSSNVSANYLANAGGTVTGTVILNAALTIGGGGSISFNDGSSFTSTAKFLLLAGGTMTGAINMGNYSITGTGGATIAFSSNSGSPCVSISDINCQYINFDSVASSYVGNSSGTLNLAGSSIVTNNGTKLDNGSGNMIVNGYIQLLGTQTMGGPSNPSVTLACDHYGNMVASCNGVPHPSLTGFGSIITTVNTLDDGNGNCNLAGGASFGGNSGSAQALATSSGTVTIYSGSLWYGTVRLNPSGNCTGAIIPAVNGSSTHPAYGQNLTIINESAFTITFAASGTSHVADGASDVIAATKAAIFVWDSGTNLWYRVG